MNIDEEIKQYEEELEKIKNAYSRCMGILQYLESKKTNKEEESKEKDK